MEHICSECKFFRMHYDKHDWEYFSCCNERGKETNDEFQEACEEFEERED